MTDVADDVWLASAGRGLNLSLRSYNASASSTLERNLFIGPSGATSSTTSYVWSDDAKLPWVCQNFFEFFDAVAHHFDREHEL